MVLSTFILLDLLNINHPVHVISSDNQLSPSAFIPFCDFGGNMSAMGVDINEFDVPVCNSFEEKILNDQLCYEVDLKKFSNPDNIENELKVGFYFLMDYNEDRQVTFNQEPKNLIFQAFAKKVKSMNLATSIAQSNLEKKAVIYLDTVGKQKQYNMKC